MNGFDPVLAKAVTRRRSLSLIGSAGAGALAAPVLAGSIARLALSDGLSTRPMSTGFPQKGAMIVQRERPPLLETPMEVFDRNIFTPNDQFFVRWHWADIPSAIDVEAFRLAVRGHVHRPIALSLAELLRLPRVEIAAVNQCSGNSRGLFSPRVPGAQWSNGAMGNARWMGVSLKAILDIAGIRPGVGAIRFAGLDRPMIAGAPDFRKSLLIDHAMDGEVMVAFAMNGVQLPLLNGFPLRLVVPGWYSTYWVKMLSDVEVLTGADDDYWMEKAYKIPSAIGANVAPGTKDFPSVPINRMIPRSWVTNVSDGMRLAYAPELPVGGIAMGGDCGVSKVEISSDGGLNWVVADLGPDAGKYSFRRFDGVAHVPRRGAVMLMSRSTNEAGVVQSLTPNWNPGGFMRGCVEITHVNLT